MSSLKTELKTYFSNRLNTKLLDIGIDKVIVSNDGSNYFDGRYAIGDTDCVAVLSYGNASRQSYFDFDYFNSSLFIQLIVPYNLKQKCVDALDELVDEESSYREAIAIGTHYIALNLNTPTCDHYRRTIRGNDYVFVSILGTFTYSKTQSYVARNSRPKILIDDVELNGVLAFGCKRSSSRDGQVIFGSRFLSDNVLNESTAFVITVMPTFAQDDLNEEIGRIANDYLTEDGEVSSLRRTIEIRESDRKTTGKFSGLLDIETNLELGNFRVIQLTISR